MASNEQSNEVALLDNPLSLSETFPKQHRLIAKSDYDRVFKQADKISSSCAIFLFRQNDCGYARLGLAAQRRHLTTAVQRNVFKRLAREGFRRARLPAIDIVVLTRPLKHFDKRAIYLCLNQQWRTLCHKFQQKSERA